MARSESPSLIWRAKDYVTIDQDGAVSLLPELAEKYRIVASLSSSPTARDVQTTAEFLRNTYLYTPMHATESRRGVCMALAPVRLATLGMWSFLFDWPCKPTMPSGPDARRLQTLELTRAGRMLGAEMVVVTSVSDDCGAYHHFKSETVGYGKFATVRQAYSGSTPCRSPLYRVDAVALAPRSPPAVASR